MDSGIDLSKALGDTRVVLYISEATHLPIRGLVDVPIEVAGEKIELHLDLPPRRTRRSRFQ